MITGKMPTYGSVSKKEAVRLRKKFLETYPNVAKFHKEMNVAKRKTVKAANVDIQETVPETAFVVFADGKMDLCSGQSGEQALARSRKKYPDCRNIRVVRVTFHESVTFSA